MEVYVCKKILNNNQGFSFIDVLVAAVLFSFLVIGVLLMTSMGIKTNSWAQHHTKAVQLAESGLELMRRVNYTTELSTYDGLVEEYGSIPQYMEFRRSYQVTYTPDISTIQVTVTWRSQNMNSFPIVLTSQRIKP
jgi:hypothetical protein